jgi:Ras family protein T1
VQWQLFTLLEPQSALAFLIYLGFPDRDIGSAFRVTRRRRLDRKKKKATRDVIQGFVFGPSGVGKSAIVDGLIDR